MWMARPAATGPVDKAFLSPLLANSKSRLNQRLHGVVPVIHTPYDYDKGIS
jgi:hypothetical protein